MGPLLTLLPQPTLMLKPTLLSCTAAWAMASTIPTPMEPTPPMLSLLSTLLPLRAWWRPPPRWRPLCTPPPWYTAVSITPLLPPPSSTTLPPMSPPPSSTLPATTPTLAAPSTLSRGRLMLMLMLTLPTTILDITTPMPTAASGGSTAASPTRPTTVATSGNTTTRVPANVQPFLQQLKSMETHPCPNFFFLLNKIKI